MPLKDGGCDHAEKLSRLSSCGDRGSKFVILAAALVHTQIMRKNGSDLMSTKLEESQCWVKERSAGSKNNGLVP